MLGIRKLLYSATICLFSMLLPSCSGFLEPELNNELPDENAVTNVKEAQSALNGVYSGFGSSDYYGTSMITYGDVRGEDMATRLNGDRTISQYTYGHATALNSTNAGYFWEIIHANLNRVNNLIAKIDAGKVNVVSEDDVKKLEDVKAQALLQRALMHFDITKIYGEPYLKNKTAWGAILLDKVITKEGKPQRSTVEQTYAFILKDIKTALGIGTNKVLISKTQTTPGKFNYWSGKALLSRVYLYMGDYENAYKEAVDVIKNGDYSLISNANYVKSWGERFTTESIFEIYTSDTENANREGIGFVLDYLSPGYKACTATNNFISLLNEDPKDVRKKIIDVYEDNSGTFYMIRKYPGRDGNIYVNNTRVIRLSDIYLIAAEAGVRTGKADASDYLNAIRQRANPDAANVVATLELVEKERRKELFGEGHRFFDITRDLGSRTIKRSGAPSRIPVVRPDQVPEISWDNKQTYLLILPIPQAEIDVNSDIHQNEGYPKSN